MAGFEKLRIWQEAHNLFTEIYEIIKTLPREEKYRLVDQIERSSSSVCANIAEAYSSYYYNNKIKGMYTARREIGETQNHVRKLEAKKYINRDQAEGLIKQYDETVRGINAFIGYICKKRDLERRKVKA